MNNSENNLPVDPIPWLLEADDPSVRYLTLVTLLDRPASDPDVQAARAAIMSQGPVPTILAAQGPEGNWLEPGPGYTPKYQSSVWQIIFLAQLGADLSDERVRLGCEYLLEHTQATNGGFSHNGRPGGAVHCLNGNLVHALLALGYRDDPRIEAALHWQARAISGEGFDRYYKSGTTGPGFCCSGNYGLPCAWGAIKALLGFSQVPLKDRDPVLQAAIDTSIDFLLSYNLHEADYPHQERINGGWFKFGFPLGYTSDILQALVVLAHFDRADDPRLVEAIEFVRSKQDAQGRWKMEKSLNGKMWADIEQIRQPSKWVTLHALYVLNKASGSS